MVERRRQSQPGIVWKAVTGGPLWIAMILCVCGCTASHYRRSADREAYQIIQDANRRVFGRTNVFTIDTRYSARAPQGIPSLEIIEDRTQTNRRVLSLSETLDLAIQNSREYQAQKEQLYLTALSLTGARYEFTPIFLANSVGQVDGSPDGSTTGSLHSRVGVSQLFKTGGTLSLALANDLLRYFSGRPPGVSRNSAIDLISVDLAQPLLQGFGQNDPRVESLTQAERNVVYGIRSFSYYQQQFAVNVVSDYFGLLGLKQEVRNNYTNYLRRVDLTKFTEARAVDRVRAADVADARTAELGARIGYINSVALYLNQLDAFKLRLGLPITETIFLSDADLRQLERVGLIPVALRSDTAFALAVEKNLELLNTVDRFEDSKRKVRLAADQLKPRLNLFANASLESEPPSDYAHFDPDKVRYQVGLSLDNLVDKLPSRNVYRATLVSFESQLRNLVSGLDSLRDRIDRGLRTVEQDRQNYLNREAALEVASRRLEMNQMLLEIGRVQVRDLREAQDALILAQNQVTDSIVNYLGARLDVLREVGVLTTSPEQFWLKDPLASEPRMPRHLSAQPQPPENELVLPDQVLEPSS